MTNDELIKEAFKAGAIYENSFTDKFGYDEKLNFDNWKAKQVKKLNIDDVSNNEVTVCELTEWDGVDETNLCDCGKGEGNCRRQTDC